MAIAMVAMCTRGMNVHINTIHYLDGDSYQWLSCNLLTKSKYFDHDYVCGAYSNYIGVHFVINMQLS
jgi:hypothetical protein